MIRGELLRSLVTFTKRTKGESGAGPIIEILGMQPEEIVDATVYDEGLFWDSMSHLEQSAGDVEKLYYRLGTHTADSMGGYMKVVLPLVSMKTAASHLDKVYNNYFGGEPHAVRIDPLQKGDITYEIRDHGQNPPFINSIQGWLEALSKTSRGSYDVKVTPAEADGVFCVVNVSKR